MYSFGVLLSEVDTGEGPYKSIHTLNGSNLPKPLIAMKVRTILKIYICLSNSSTKCGILNVFTTSSTI